MSIVNVSEIESFTPHLDEEGRQELIDAAEAIAAHYAPCLRAETVAPHIRATAKALILNALKYDVQVNGPDSTQTRQTEQLGPYGVTNYPLRSSGTFFSPAQVEILRSLCVSTTPTVYSIELGLPDTLARG